MPIGNTFVYNAGDLILHTVSSSGNTFQEVKLAAATSSLVLFNSNGTLTSQSLNTTTIGTSSVSLFTSGSTSIITNLTGSNISASKYIQAGGNIYQSLTSSLISSASYSNAWVRIAQWQNNYPSTELNGGFWSQFKLNISVLPANPNQFYSDDFISTVAVTGSNKGNLATILLTNAGYTNTPSIAVLNAYSYGTPICTKIRSAKDPLNSTWYIDAFITNQTANAIDLMRVEINEGRGNVQWQLNPVSSSYTSSVEFDITTPGVKNANTYVYNFDGNVTSSGNLFIGGNVGIGSTATDSNKLKVSGNISASAITASLFFGTASWAQTASNALYSDIALYSVSSSTSQDITLYVKNTSGAIIPKGRIVRIKDVENASFNPTIELADYRYESSSANTVGYTNETFAINAFGYVITEGKLTGVDTSAFTAGDLLYLSSSGQFTNVKPTPPDHGVRVGQVIRSNNSNGSIYVTIDNGAELDELHNVIDTSTTSSYGDLLVKSGSVWKNSNSLTGSYFITGSLNITQNISASGTGSFGVVGIGITNPISQLHISGSVIQPFRIEYEDSADTNAQLYIEGNKSAGSPALATAIELKSNTNYRGRGIIYSISGSGQPKWYSGVPYTGAGFSIGYDSTGAFPWYVASSSFFITPTRNVGIGTTSPVNKLDVTGNISASTITASLFFGTASWAQSASYVSPTGNAYVLGGNSFSQNAMIGINDNYRLDIEANGSAILSLTGSTVGIGTTTPDQTVRLSVLNRFKVDANGMIRVGGSTNTGNAYVDFGNASTLGNATIVYGVTGEPANTGSGNVVGAFITPRTAITASTITYIRGAQFGIRNVGSGSTITNGIAYYASSPVVNSGSVTTATGLYIDRQKIASGVTTGYGIFQADSNDINYFAGAVGIGTTNPLYKLDVSGSGRILSTLNVYNASDSTATLAVFDTSSLIPVFRILQDSTSNKDAVLIMRDSSDTNVLVFNTNGSSYINGGNVGIGTTNAVARLAVTPSGSLFDSTNVMVAYFGKTTSNGYGSTFIRVAQRNNITTTGSAAISTEYTDVEHNSAGAGPYRYGTYGDTNIINGASYTNGIYGSINFVTSGSTRMTIAGGTSAGNIGIGTTNPSVKLHVVGTISASIIDAATQFLGNTGDNASTPSFSFTNDTNTGMFNPLSGDSIAFSTNGIERLRITTSSLSSSVGITAASFTGSIFGTSSWSTNSLTASSLVPTNNYTGNIITATGYLTSARCILTTTDIVALSTTNTQNGSGSLYANTMTYNDLSNGDGTNTLKYTLLNSYNKSTTSSLATYFQGNYGANTAINSGSVALLYDYWSRVQVRPSASIGTLIHYQADSGYLGTGSVTGSITNRYCFNAADIYQGAKATNQYGLYVANFVNSDNAYAVYTANASGNNQWNIYSVGTAPNYFNGNVGIGTTAPSTLLQIYTGSSAASAIHQLEISSAATKKIFFLTNASAGSYNPIVAKGDSGILFSSASINNSQCFFIAPWSSTIGGISISGSGQVGIGTSDPRGGTLFVSGNITASSVTASLLGNSTGTSSWAQTASVVSPSGNAYIQGGNSFGASATLGTNDANSLALKTNGSTRMTIGAGGQIAINTSPGPGVRFYVNEVQNSALGSASVYINTKQNSTDIGNNINTEGILNEYVVTGNPSGSTQIQSQFNNLYISSSGNITGSYRALRNNVTINAPVTMSATSGLINLYLLNQFNLPATFSAVNIPDYRIINTSLSTFGTTPSGSISSFYDIVAGGMDNTFGNSLSIDNSIGVYIQNRRLSSATITNSWGLYQLGANDNNYFAGKVGIGITNPVNKLDVVGNVSASVITASLFFGTSSWAQTASALPVGTYAITSSWATTSSWANNVNTASWANNATTAQTASFLPVGTYNITSSWATNATTAHALNTGLSYTVNNFTASNITASTVTSSNVLVNGNLTVTGSIFASIFSASNVYITSSQFVVTDNIITLNALTPYQRYAGLQMFDSGSGTISNLLWDGQGDYFFISGSGVNGKIISGPDAQADLTTNYVPKATAGYILGNSTIQDNGSGVGILTAPNSIAGLTVNGNILFNTNYLIWGSGSATNMDYIGANDGTHGITNNNAGYWVFNHDAVLSTNSGSTSTLDFGSFSANNATDNNYIAGNLLVGTTSSTAKVDISYGDYQNNGALRLGADIGTNTSRTNNTRKIGMITGVPYNNLSGSPVFTFIDANSTYTIVNVGGGASGKSGATEIRFFTTNSVSAVNTTAKVVIDSEGDMGIGVLSPVNKLDVAGNISCSVITASNFFGTSSWASNSLTASYLTPTNSYTITNLTASSISASGTIRAVSLIETSTIASKYNIIPLENQLDKLLKLNPVSFNYKQTDEPSIGLIAEEVGEIYPEFTSPNKDAVAYSKMVSVLIQSVKELKSIVDVQQKQINELLKK